MKTENSSTLITQRKNLTLKKDHRRSVTHNLYESTIQNVNNEYYIDKEEGGGFQEGAGSESQIFCEEAQKN